jgi:hypothetical protein
MFVYICLLCNLSSIFTIMYQNNICKKIIDVFNKCFEDNLEEDDIYLVSAEFEEEDTLEESEPETHFVREHPTDVNSEDSESNFQERSSQEEDNKEEFEILNKKEK